MNIDISIIIVNFNTCQLLQNCLESIGNYTPNLTIQTIVVDNNSQDQSLDMLRSKYPKVEIIANPANRGFAAANNQGLSRAKGKYLFLLNPDTELFENTLSTLKTFLDDNPDIGAVGPRTYLDHTKTLEVCSLKILSPLRAVACFSSFPWPGRKKILKSLWQIDANLWNSKMPCQVEGIGGAAFFTRTNILRDIGGLDEQFFMGYEDTDLAAQFRKLHHPIFIHPESHVLHLFGQAKKLPQAPDETIYSWNKTPATFLKKYYGTGGSVLLKCAKSLDKCLPSTTYPGSDIQTLSPKNNLVLKWHTSHPGPYLLEISNDSPFFDKFAARTTQPQLVINKTILNRIFHGTWYWRVFPDPIQSLDTNLGKGRFHINA